MDDNVATFMGVTGCEDRGTAQFYLESSGNDLDQAVNNYMESGGAAPGEMQPAADQTEDVAAVGASVNVDVTGPGASGEDEQRWFTGGQGGSGQEVIAPGSSGPNMAAFEDVRKAVEPHARHGTSEDLAPESSAFTGAARTLDGQIRNAPKKKTKMIIKFYPNHVFTVDDGPARSTADAANQRFLKAIKEQRIPDELVQQYPDGLDLSIMPMPEDYDPGTAPRPTFTGTGRKLGSDEASTSAAAAPPQQQQPMEAWSGPDESQPMTSIQIRMPDGTRLVGKFNHTQRIREIRAFVAAVRPGEPVPPVMMSGFPAKPVEDESVTIADGGLISAVVVFK